MNDLSITFDRCTCYQQTHSSSYFKVSKPCQNTTSSTDVNLSQHSNVLATNLPPQLSPQLSLEVGADASFGVKGRFCFDARPWFIRVYSFLLLVMSFALHRLVSCYTSVDSLRYSSTPWSCFF